MGLTMQCLFGQSWIWFHCWFSCHYFSTLIGKLLFCSLWFYAKMGSWSLLYLLAGDVSKFGAGLFLLVQVLILLDFTHSWNDTWVEKDEQKWWVVVLIYVISAVTGLIWVVTVWIYIIQVYRFAFCINWVLHCSICVLRHSVHLVQPLWQWLWP